MAKTVYLTTPLKKEDIEALEIDDVVYISGDLYTMMYADHFTRIMDMIDAGEKPPMELEGAAIYNTGTIFRRMEDGTYDFRAIGTTTSSKFNPYTPDFIRLAESYGAKGIRVTKTEEIAAAFEEAKKNTRKPTIIEFIIDPEEMVYPMIKPGGTLADMIMDC